MLDLFSIASVTNTAKNFVVVDDDYGWGAVARAYTSVEGFWEAAELRPNETSFPLGSWRAELKRMVVFKRDCFFYYDEIIGDVDIMYLWQCMDRNIDRGPEANEEATEISILTPSNTNVSRFS